VIAPPNTPAIDRVLARGCWTPVQRFGPDAQWRAGPSDAHGHFDVYHDSVLAGRVCWTLSGEHNRMNALAALAAAHHAGVSIRQGIAALSVFDGVKRRMELRGVVNDIRVYDDFAHHPTAIATTLEGLRQRVGGARIIAVLEPRSNTMKLGAMAARLPDSLQTADAIFCYGAQDGKHALGWDAATVLAPLGERAHTFDDLNQMVTAIAALATAGDHVVVMSNGSFGGIHEKLLHTLEATQPATVHLQPLQAG